jgi:hypothetical protein
VSDSDFTPMPDEQLTGMAGFGQGLEAAGMKEAGATIFFLVRELRWWRKQAAPLPAPPPSHTSRP